MSTATERGGPQFYLLGPAPEHDCALCVSRLAQGYVLEDGIGRLIGEALALDRFAGEAARCDPRQHAPTRSSGNAVQSSAASSTANSSFAFFSNRRICS
jgi:hypothetical protein